MKKKYKLATISLMFFIIIALVFYGLTEFLFYYVDGPGFKTLTLQEKTFNDFRKDGDSVIFKFVTVGHIKGIIRRDLPQDHPLINSHAEYNPEIDLNQVIKRELTGKDYFDGEFIKAIPRIKELDPEILFVTGDVIPFSTVDIFERDDRVIDSVREKEILEYAWEMMLPVFDDMGINYVIAPGNHDIYGKTAEMVFREKVGELYFSFSRENIRFVILNSVQKDTSGIWWSVPANLGQDQIKFLKRGITSEWEEDNIFLFIHNNPWGIPNWKTEVHPLLIGSNCQTVISGSRFGTFGATNRDRIIYLDGGFELSPTKKPSYFVSTKVWESGKIQHRIHYVLPSEFTDKVQVYFHLYKDFIIKVLKYAKKHLVIS